MNNSFIVLLETKDTTKETISNQQILRKKEIIDSICNGFDTGYLTEYPNIVKLCRVCITDTCKTLISLINWETTRYKTYTQALNNNPPDNLIEELNINITDSKYLYENYNNLYQTLKTMKLYTNECYICYTFKNSVPADF